MGLAVAKEYTIRNNTCATATQFEHPDKERDKEQLGLLGGGHREKRLGDVVTVHAASEGRIGQAKGVFVLVRIGGGEAVLILNIRADHAV